MADKSAEEYYKKYGINNEYSMESISKHTSRVHNLIKFVKQVTPVGGKILDVGCGDLYLSKVLPEYNWTGLDINPANTNTAIIKHNIDNTPYPFENNSFDTVICSEVLEHMFNPMDINKEIRRIIKESGKYICSTPNFQWIDNYLNFFSNLKADRSKPWTYEHIRQYDINSHAQILNEAGFYIEQFTGADAQFSTFFCQGRETLRKVLESFGDKDPNYTRTDQIIGEMFPLHNHTIMIVSDPV